MVRMLMRWSDEKAATLPLPTSLVSYELRGRDMAVSAHEAPLHVGVTSRGALSTGLPTTFYTMATEGEVRAAKPVSRSFVGMVIMERSRDGSPRPTVQIARPTKSFAPPLEIIKSLCGKFVEVYGCLPAEVSLHILLRLELMVWGYTCIYGGLCDGREGAMVKIPFVAHGPSKRKSMIIVRGRADA